MTVSQFHFSQSRQCRRDWMSCSVVNIDKTHTYWRIRTALYFSYIGDKNQGPASLLRVRRERATRPAEPPCPSSELGKP